MNFRLTYKWYLLSGVILILLIVLVDRIEDVLTHIEYPLDTWRMDLDDLTANIIAAGVSIGTLLLGAAAWKKAGRAGDKADRVEHQINGGMGDIAREQVNGVLENSEIEVGLWRRVDALEESKADCIEREKRCTEENEKLRHWVIARLDQTPLGREGARG